MSLQQNLSILNGQRYQNCCYFFAKNLLSRFKLLQQLVHLDEIFYIQLNLYTLYNKRALSKQIASDMQDYKIQSKKGEGTYSEVFMAINRKQNKKVALKIMKHKYQSLNKIKKDKQIKALKTLSHPNIITLIDVLYNQKEQKMALVFQLMDCNLYQYYKNKKNNLNIDKIRSIGYDILQAINYMHSKQIFHRDIKPQNILVHGDKQFKLADLGSCKNLHSSWPHTEYISTRWYRAPQCLMTDGYYSEKMDIWSIGCYPLFPGKSEVDQISTIFSVLGTPQQSLLYRFAKKSSNLKFDFQEIEGIGLENLLTNAQPQFLDLIKKMVCINPDQRITAKEALNHSFFYSLTQLKKYRKNIITKIVAGNKQFMLPGLKSHRKLQY